MPEHKITLALTPPACILLFVLQVFFTLSLCIGSGDETREGVQESDAYPTVRNFSRGANGYTMPGRKEVAWWGQ